MVGCVLLTLTPHGARQYSRELMSTTLRSFRSNTPLLLMPDMMPKCSKFTRMLLWNSYVLIVIESKKRESSLLTFSAKVYIGSS